MLIKGTNEILDFLDYAGIRYDHDRTEAWPVEHDSLKIALKPGKEYYNWYSQGTWGHLYDFVQEYSDSTFTPVKNRREAAKLIRQFRKERGKGKLRSFEVTENRKFDAKDLVRSPNATHLMRYLHDKRGLDELILNRLIKAGRLAETISQYEKGDKHYKFHNAAFLWRDHTGKLVGADIQGTSLKNKTGGKHDNIKLIQPGSQHDFGWNFKTGDPQKTNMMVVTEAPIDTISYYQLFHRNADLLEKNVVYASLSGASTKIEGVGHLMKDLIETNSDNKLKALHFAVDDDDAGQKFVKKWIDAGLHDSQDMRVFVDIPKNGHKDWNEELTAGDTGKTQVTIDQFAQMHKHNKNKEDNISQVNKRPYAIKRKQTFERPFNRKEVVYR